MIIYGEIMTNQTIPFVPTAPSERFVSLDLLRGFAVFGILIMNIQIFSNLLVKIEVFIVGIIPNLGCVFEFDFR